MNPQSRDRCLCAVAYLKIELPPSEASVVTLSNEDAPVLKRLENGLIVAYLVDEGASYSYVQNRDLGDAGLSPEELHEEGIANLSALAEAKLEVRQHGNIFVALMGGDFEASLLLVSEFWSHWYASLAPGGFVVAIPARDVLAFGDASSPTTIEELAAIGNKSPNLDHPLTTRLYKRVGSTWATVAV